MSSYICMLENCLWIVLVRWKLMMESEIFASILFIGTKDIQYLSSLNTSGNRGFFVHTPRPLLHSTQNKSTWLLSPSFFSRPHEYYFCGYAWCYISMFSLVCQPLLSDIPFFRKQYSVKSLCLIYLCLVWRLLLLFLSGSIKKLNACLFLLILSSYQVVKYNA